MAYVPTELVEVRAWGRTVGAVAPGRRRGAWSFQFDPEWIRTGIELAPGLMPLSRRTYSFPELNPQTYRGLPPMIADSLPDRFGNSIVDAWMARNGVAADQITALDRLAYLGPRGLGALEYVPDRAPHLPAPTGFDLLEIVTAARAAVDGSLASEAESEETLRRIIEVGTSAGGARAKAIINYNRITDEIRSGHIAPTAGFEPWLLKLDGVGADEQLGTGGNYGRIEFAYSLMAAAADIHMSETKLLREHGRAHFMTRRFDRSDGGAKLHLQSLCAIAGLDYNAIGVHDYAQLLTQVQALGLGDEATAEAWRRMVFNVATANHDDHTKNHAFLFEPADGWRLAPAYDLTHAYTPGSTWTDQHLMSVNGKFRDITRDDLLAVADQFEVPGARAALGRILDVVDSWPEFAGIAEVPPTASDEVAVDFQVTALQATRGGRR
jgi:serine/threonine-protein kinase HipA